MPVLQSSGYLIGAGSVFHPWSTLVFGVQRPRLFCTTEDMFTQSFILPYVIPMLENAGAIVYTPRERDTQKNEIIVDNDTPNASLYLEVGSKKARWTTTSVKGFAQKKAIYKDGENPFTDGTAAYFLIDLKFRDTPIMKDEVFGIAHAIG